MTTKNSVTMATLKPCQRIEQLCKHENFKQFKLFATLEYISYCLGVILNCASNVVLQPSGDILCLVFVI